MYIYSQKVIAQEPALTPASPKFMRSQPNSKLFIRDSSTPGPAASAVSTAQFEMLPSSETTSFGCHPVSATSANICAYGWST